MKMRRAFAAFPLVLALVPSSAAAAADGKAVYEEVCQACHQPDGTGAPGLAPALVSLIVEHAAARQKDYLPLVVLKGLAGTISLADGGSLTSAMPPQSKLSDDEIAAAVNYVLRLNNQAPGFQAADVATLRAAQVGNDELKRRRMELSK